MVKSLRCQLVETTDNCDNVVDIQFAETTSGAECPYTITRTWTATDECSNVSSESQIITINAPETDCPELGAKYW